MALRHFDGVDDLIVLALGSLGFAFGPGTIAAWVAKSDDSGTETVLKVGTSSVSSQYSLIFQGSSVRLQCGTTPVGSTNTLVTAADGICFVAATKATGTVAPRLHVYWPSTETWLHEDGSTTLANSGTPGTSARIGATQTPSNFFHGDVGILAVWNTVLNDAQIEALVIEEQEWIDASPLALLPSAEFADDTTTLQDTIGTADESSRTGTSAVAGDIPWVGSAPPIEIDLTPATTLDEAQALSYSVETPILVDLTPATTIDVAQPLSGGGNSYELTPATTSDVAQALSYSVFIPPNPWRDPPLPAPSRGTDYIFELADSKTQERIGELTQARNRQLVLALNKAGALTFGLPLKDDLSLLVEEVVTCVRIKRRLLSGEHKIEWEGPVWTVDEETPDTLSVGCVGWLQTLEKRVIKPTTATWPSWIRHQYADWDAGAIALDLLFQSNGDSDYSDTNFVVPGGYQATQPRTKTYQPWEGVLSAIQELTELESGFDMEVDPTTRELFIYEKLRNIWPEVRFEYGANVIKARRSSDSSKMCNRCIVYSSSGYAVAEDQPSISEFGLFEEAISLTGVTDIEIMQALANAEVAVRSRPLRLSSFDPRKYTSAHDEDPRIFRDFRVGDVVFHHVHRGRLDIDVQAHRIFGVTVTWDSSGAEQLSALQTTAS